MAVVVVAMLLGGWRVATAFALASSPSSLVVGDVSYTVVQTDQVTGLTQADLAGMNHGIQSLVTSDKALISVSVLVSADDSAARYDPADLRVYADGAATGIEPVGGTLLAGSLLAHGNIEGAVSFVVPRDGARLVLRAEGGSHEVPLLQLDLAGPDDGPAHPHTTTYGPTTPTAPAAVPSQVRTR
jgi:hypothetical protein